MNDQTRLTMRDLPADDRPTEKLLRQGALALSDAELIAVIIRHGSRRESALALAQRLITTLEDERNENALSFICSSSIEEMTRLKGIGPVKAVQLKAAVELGGRISRRERTIEQKQIQSPHDLFPFMEQQMAGLPREEMRAILLDNRNRIIRQTVLSIGGLSGAAVYPRDLFREAVKANAAGLILVHNHPSGEARPSREDIETTKHLVELGKALGIKVLDHLIIASRGSLSMRQQGIF